MSKSALVMTSWEARIPTFAQAADARVTSWDDWFQQNAQQQRGYAGTEDSF